MTPMSHEMAERLEMYGNCGTESPHRENIASLEVGHQGNRSLAKSSGRTFAHEPVLEADSRGTRQKAFGFVVTGGATSVIFHKC
jgi:hypothetical protein